MLNIRCDCDDEPHSRRCEPRYVFEGKIIIAAMVHGYRYEQYRAEIDLSDITWMNTECAHWLEEHGVTIPDTQRVDAIGYAANIKQKEWESRKKNDP